MTVSLEQVSGEACPPDSFCGSFLAIAGCGLGSRLPFSASTTDLPCHILPTKLCVGASGGGLSSCPVRGASGGLWVLPVEVPRRAPQVPSVTW